MGGLSGSTLSRPGPDPGPRPGRRTDLDVAGLHTERSGRPVDAGRLAARARRWALADVAGFVPTLLAAEEETPDTAWQVTALLGTLEEL